MKFVAGQACRFRVDVFDKKGIPAIPDSAVYSVYDADDEPLATNVAYSEAIHDVYVDIDIDGALNATSASKDVRRVEVTATFVDGSTTVQSQSYILNAVVPLTVADNSFQTLQSAIMFADDIPNTYGFDDADDGDRVSALKQAYLNISNLRFQHTPADSMSRIGGTLRVNRIDELTKSEFNDLPSEFRQALKLAQIAEADTILGGDPIDDMRQSGLMSKTVGESSQMFRPGTPMKLPISRRAYGLLKKYIVKNSTIGRG